VLIKHGTGVIIALEIDERFLDVELHSLMLINWQYALHNSHFLPNPTFGVISTTERLLSNPRTTGEENDFLELLV